MPLFSTLAALSQTAASNPPDGAVDLPSTIDDQLRLLGSFIAQLRDGSGFTGGAVVPAGTLLDYAGGAAPTGFLSCDGSAVSRTTYSALFTAISTTWGVGDGSTTFNLPDLRGRSSIGSGTGTGLTARTLGTQNIGEETHVLTTAELAAHNHTATSTFTGSALAAHGHTVNDGPHAHNVPGTGGGGSTTGLQGTNGGGPLGGVTTDLQPAGVSVNAASAGTPAGSVATTTANAGSGTAHNNMQPSAVVNKIIKT